MNKLMFALAAGLVTMGAAQAQTVAATAPQVYVGVAGSVADNQTSDEYRLAPKIFGGYEFDQNWGIEAGYTHYDNQHTNVQTSSGIGILNTDGDSSYIAGKYTLPINAQWSAYGKLGVAYNERNNSGVDGTWTERDTGLYTGVGAEYKLNERLSLVGEYERYGKHKDSGTKADGLTVGLKVGF